MSEIRLVFGKKTSAVINTMGAETKSLIIGKRELMWQAGEEWSKTAPWLFPMVGALKNGKTLIDGKEYAVPRHGFARENEFASTQITENTAVFTLKQNEKTLSVYPFQFTLTIKYQLFGDRLRATCTVANNSTKTMLYCIGGHPAFNVPFEQGEKFSDYGIFFENPETAASPSFNKDGLFENNNRVPRLDNSNEFRLTHETFDGDCVYLDKITSKSVLLSKDGEKGIKAEWSGFSTLGIWSPPGKNAPFVCIEPWCGSADFSDGDGIFANKPGIQTLAPDETKSYTLQIKAV
jgi:galactose mutarotase-like enzyme